MMQIEFSEVELEDLITAMRGVCAKQNDLEITAMLQGNECDAHYWRGEYGASRALLGKLIAAMQANLTAEAL